MLVSKYLEYLYIGSKICGRCQTQSHKSNHRSL